MGSVQIKLGSTHFPFQCYLISTPKPINMDLFQIFTRGLQQAVKSVFKNPYNNKQLTQKEFFEYGSRHFQNRNSLCKTRHILVTFGSKFVTIGQRMRMGRVFFLISTPKPIGLNVLRTRLYKPSEQILGNVTFGDRTHHLRLVRWK